MGEGGDVTTVFLLASGFLLAQFVSNTRLVELHASVVNKKGQLVTDLSRDAFKVTKTGRYRRLRSSNGKTFRFHLELSSTIAAACKASARA